MLWSGQLLSVLWTNCGKESLGRVLKLQKRVARVILKALPLAPSVPLFNRLKWLPFHKDALISKRIIAYKRLQGDVPVYLNNLLKLNVTSTVDKPDTAILT